MPYDPYAQFRDIQKSKSTASSTGAWQTDPGGGGGIGGGFGGGGGVGMSTTSRPGSSSTSESNQSAINAGAMSAQYKQDRWNQIWPWLQGQFSQQPLGPWNQGPGPQITVRGVLNPQQIQQQVNASRAANDKSTATQNQAAAAKTAGQGFGSNSPLLAALQGSNNMANLAANTANERDLRLNAAQQNAQQFLNTQSAAANVYGERQREALQARGQSLSTFNALLSALGGFA